MRESTTYQAILAEEARAIVLRVGRKRFGAPDSDTVAALEHISNVARLEQMAERMLDAKSWSDLMAS